MKSNLQDTLVTEFEIYENISSKVNDSSNDVDKNFEIRKKAIEHFKLNGWPTLKDELWKYTPVNFVNKIDFKLTINPDFRKIVEDEVNKCLINGLDAYRVVLVNGFYDESHSDIGDPELGIKINSTKDYTNQHVNADSDFLTPDYSEHPFAAVNTALSQDGFLITVSAGSEIKKPIHIINIVDTDAEPIFAQAKNFVIMAPNSKASIIETNRTLGYNESLISSVTKIEVGEGAKLHLYKIQDDTDRAYSVSVIETNCRKDSQFTQMNVTLGGRFVRNDVRVKLLGENSYPSLEGVFVSKKDMLVDNHTFLDHAVPNCPSNELYRAVLDDKSKGVFNGKILVRQDAQKTNAYQSSKAVLLSDSAVMNSKPELEIYADDVKCSHGASTGSIDEEALFYLRSRGISEAKARALLLNAFVHEITNRIHISELREYVNQRVDEIFHV